VTVLLQANCVDSKVLCHVPVNRFDIDRHRGQRHILVLQATRPLSVGDKVTNP
jgi:hypothetical protein